MIGHFQSCDSLLLSEQVQKDSLREMRRGSPFIEMLINIYLILILMAHYIVYVIAIFNFSSPKQKIEINFFSFYS